MSTYTLESGKMVATELALASWNEDTRWNGNNRISVATGSQWEHETLYRSKKGTYYVVHTSQWQGSLPSASELSFEEAARWLIANRETLPEDLAKREEELVE